MSRTRNLLATSTLVFGTSAALVIGGSLGFQAAADPAPPIPMPINGLQAPGLSAIESLSPAIQQAAANPGNASSMLMAAAAAFSGNGTPDSQSLASAVSQFVSDPPAALPATSHPLPNSAGLPGPAPAAAADHIPPAGVVPGAEAHLPPGIDPAHAAGPADDPAAAPLAAVAAPAPAEPPAAPAAEPAAAPVIPAAATAPVPDAAPAPVPDAAAPPAPGADTQPGPAPAPGFGPDAPVTQDFMYPSIGNGCLADGSSSIATAISVAGPATIPAPGPAAGQTAYVFTAVGTAAPAAEQKLPLNVTWVNLTSGKSGTVTLKPRSDINPAGPTTLTAIADTGSGSIMSTIFGQVTTTEKQCQFMPTIGSTVVP